MASLVVGAHTHTPTADAQIYPGGTAFQSDAGMCGDYDSVIGMKKEIVLERTVTRLPAPRMALAKWRRRLWAFAEARTFQVHAL